MNKENEIRMTVDMKRETIQQLHDRMQDYNQQGYECFIKSSSGGLILVAKVKGDK